MIFRKYRADVLLIVHFIFGMSAAFVPSLVFVWVILVFCSGLGAAINKSQRLAPHFFAAYLVGIELLDRMSSSGLPHEFAKYAVSAILLASIIRTSWHLAHPFIFMMLLLIPSIFLTNGGSLEETRQLVSGNLSGPLCLVISALYFYNRPFNAATMRRLFLALLYPLASILGYMVIKTPDFSEIDFGFQSNFVTSIYGPNQMSSILGLGVLLIGLCYFLKIRLFSSNLVVLGFLGFLLFRGLLTFSRGGMITPIILLVIIFIYFSWKIAGFNKNTVRIIFLASIFSALSFFLFDYADNITGNKLSDRYAGRRGGKQIEDIDKLTSGRTKIMVLDWLIFADNPFLGIGVGMGKTERPKYGYEVEVAAHNEFSRILAEHGSLGVVALLLLIGLPIKRFFVSKKIIERIMVIAFIGFCFVFMTHAATRIAAPCFLYGFAFVRIPKNKRALKIHDSLPGQQAFQTRQGSFSNRTAYT